jgi:hypothetical protein
VTSAPSPLMAEVVALDAIRGAAAEGELGVARGLLDDYARRFPTGMLHEEADVVRIDIELSDGELERGRGLAGKFLEAHPASPHASRLRELLSSSL